MTHAAEVQLRAVFDATDDAILTVDENQVIVLANPAAGRIFGYPLDELVGLSLDPLVPAGYRARHRQDVESFGANASASRAMGRRAVITAVRRDGSEFPAEAVISHLEADSRHMYTVVLRDVTDRQQAELALRRTQAALAESHASLQRLIKSQSEVQEEERRRIALELHDDLQQTLAAIKMDIAAATDFLHRDPTRVLPLLEDTRRLADSAIISTRRIVNDLRPQILDDLGLSAALQALASQFAQRTGIACHVSTPALEGELDGIAPATATGLYRIAQEALNNIVKHAVAGQADITLSREGPGVALQVSDDGRGIGLGDFRKNGSFGLLGMQERVRSLGGTLAVEGREGGGTLVKAIVPL